MLLIGYGNPGRLDDGLGPALASRLEELEFADLTVDSNYQLTVEDAAAVAAADLVVFVDASVSCREPFDFYPLSQRTEVGFSTHHVSPEGVIELAETLFGGRPSAYMLSIRGYDFNSYEERLSDQAQDNLQAAFDFVVPFLRQQGRNDCVVLA